MSAKDDLDRFDQDWNLHQKWRRGERTRWAMGAPNPPEKPGKYVVADGSWCDRIAFEFGRDMPEKLRHALRDNMEETFDRVVREFHKSERAKLVERARLEAESTLAQLGRAGA